MPYFHVSPFMRVSGCVRCNECVNAGCRIHDEIIIVLVISGPSNQRRNPACAVECCEPYLIRRVDVCSATVNHVRVVVRIEMDRSEIRKKTGSDCIIGSATRIADFCKGDHGSEILIWITEHMTGCCVVPNLVCVLPVTTQCLIIHDKGLMNLIGVNIRSTDIGGSWCCRQIEIAELRGPCFPVVG